MLRTRIAVRRAQRTGTPEQKAQCGKVLADRDLLGALDEELHDRYNATMQALGDGQIITFLNWLIANLPAILAAVASIIALFGA